MHYTRFRRSGDPLLTAREVNSATPPHCTFGDCRKKHYAKGLCSAHYTRLRRHGSPGKTTRVSPGSVLDWMRRHINYDSDQCLKWPFATDHSGYGLVTYKGRQRTASNVMLRLSAGEPPTRQHECAHSCGRGNMGCINPRHLRWATRSENHADKHDHNTAVVGERHRWSKLKAPDVLRIRRLEGVKTGRALAREYDVDPGTIYAIWKRRNWAWLK